MEKALYRLVQEKRKLQFFIWDKKRQKTFFGKAPFILSPQIHKMLIDNFALHVDPQDYQKIYDYIDALPSDPHQLAQNTFRVRLIDDDQQCYWLNAFIVIRKISMADYRMYGLLEDISTEVKNRLRLERDNLTGLYNREAFRQKIFQLVQEKNAVQKQYAFMIIDADNFKEINDTFGHLFGDSVLKEIAKQLNKHLGPEAIIARLGGDEFTAMLTDYQSLDNLKQKLNELLLSLKHDYSDGRRTVEFSVSIGVALYRQHHQDYRKLFDYADLALYQSKSNGKCCFAFYQNGMESLKDNCQAAITKRTKNDCELQKRQFNEHMMEYMVRFLRQTNNFVQTIDHCLELFAQGLDVDRVVLFKYDPLKDKFVLSNFYTRPDFHMLKLVTSEDVASIVVEAIRGYFLKTSDYDYIASCDNVALLPIRERVILTEFGTKSFCHNLIFAGDVLLGSVGVATSNEVHIWTDEEIHQLHRLAICFSYLLLQEKALPFLHEEA